MPKQIICLDKSAVSAYDVVSGTPRELAQLPTVSASGQTLVAQHIVHSSKKGLVLVFFRATGSSGFLTASPPHALSNLHCHWLIGIADHSRNCGPCRQREEGKHRGLGICGLARR